MIEFILAAYVVVGSIFMMRLPNHWKTFVPEFYKHWMKMDLWARAAFLLVMGVFLWPVTVRWMDEDRADARR